jgi:hypothetical protein
MDSPKPVYCRLCGQVAYHAYPGEDGGPIDQCLGCMTERFDDETYSVESNDEESQEEGDQDE